jgi:EpsI family protein
VAAAAVLLGIVATNYFFPRPAEVFPARRTFSEFPMRLGEWRGRRESLDGIYSETLKVDDYVLANYVDAGNDHAVNLWIPYYDSQRKGEAVHSPRSCLPGGGWQMRGFGQRTLTGVSIDGTVLRVNRSVVELGNQRELVYYWFQQRGRIIDNEFAVKWYLFWDALTRHRTDGAMIRVITALPPASSEVDADLRLTEFIGRFAPDMPRYVPN